MKILLDECLPVDFRHSFPGYEAHSVEWAGLKGKKNGELLQAAEDGGYQVLLTVDQGIPRQQTMGGRKLSIILIRSRTNQMEDSAYYSRQTLSASPIKRPDAKHDRCEADLSLQIRSSMSALTILYSLSRRA